MKRAALLLTFVAAVAGLAVEAHAQPYRWVDDKGVVHYSDRPPLGPHGPVEDLHPHARARESATTASPTASPTDAAARGAKAAPALSRPVIVDASGGPVDGRRDAIETSQKTAGEPRAPRDTDARRRAREIVELAGIERQVDYFARVARWEIDRVLSRHDASERTTVVLARAFHRDALSAMVVPAFERDPDRLRADAVLAWYRSPLGQRIAELRREPTRAVYEDYRDFFRRLPTTRPSPGRVALIHRMDRAWRATQFEVESSRAVRQTLERLVVVPRRPPAGRDTEDEEQDEHLARDDEDRRLGLMTWVLFRYQGFSDTEVERYVEFLESPAGAWLTRTARASLHDALKAAEDRAATALAQRR